MRAAIRIARCELKTLAREPGTAAAVLATVVLLSLAVYARLPAFRATEAWKRGAAEEVRRQWVEQGVRHPHSAAHYGLYAFRPLPAEALLEPGVSEFIGQTQPLETHKRSFPIHAPVDNATPAARMAGLSPSMVALALIPLVLILFGYGALAREREAGTLFQLLASGVAPSDVMLGKLGALLALCALLVAGKMAIEVPATLAVGVPPDWVRFAGMQGLHWVYCCIWVLAILTVSAVSRSSRTALAVLLALWTANTLLLPRVAGSAARLIVREPSVEEFRAAMQRDITTRPDGKPWVEDWSRELQERVLEQYGVGSIEDLPVGYAGIMLKGSDAHYEEVFEKHFANLQRLHKTQETWHLAVSWLGPMIAARSVSQGLAGCDLSHAADFSHAAERYRRMFVEATNDATEKLGRGTGWEVRLGQDDWEAIPAFRYETPDAGWSLRQHSAGLWVLGSWLMLSAVCFAAAVTRVARPG